MTKSFALSLGAAALGTVLAWQSNADANCAMPVGYSTHVEDNTVTICVSPYEGRGCPDESGMLRENPTTDEVVKLADFCNEDCYVDECVPPGTYRYGFAKPYGCCGSCCGTDYFGEVTVEAELAEDCARSDGNEAPELFAGSLPWGDEQLICSYSGYGGGPSGEGGSAGDAGAAGTAGSDPGSASVADDDDGGGCSIASHPRNTVLAVNLLALVFGLGILARRRRRQR